ncbi:MAG: flagellar biosynthetic protein FliR [Eubacteriales bacterium]|jgi:flagellar biosynthetic protein FliR|nr:flagellar biosynthetic protein FliR [Eubacteriales bacterium]NCC80690.1 flagellar type III secretion system protein FliR [Clostridia bacterium]
MEYIQIFYESFPTYLMVFFRIIGFLIIAPLFSSRNVLSMMKAALAMLISILVVPTMVDTPFLTIESSLLLFFIYALSEFAIGLSIGFVATLFFDAINLAGQLIDMQMGFGIVNVVDPQSGAQMPVMGTFKYFLTMFFYLSLNGHILLLDALMKSYQIIPLGNFTVDMNLMNFIIYITTNLFVVALKIALPYVGALFATDFILGIIARTVPQMNVFMIGMPLKIGIGFILTIIIIPLYIYMLSAFFEKSFTDIYTLIRVLS